MRIIPTNKLLMKYKIKASSICDFCGTNVKEIRHLFWECTHIQHFWSNISNYLESLNFSIELNYRTISLGIENKRNETCTQAKNFIILSAKYFIFKKKCLNEMPRANNFIFYLKKQIEIEKIIALSKDKLEIHEAKWRSFSQ